MTRFLIILFNLLIIYYKPIYFVMFLFFFSFEYFFFLSHVYDIWKNYDDYFDIDVKEIDVSDHGLFSLWCEYCKLNAFSKLYIILSKKKI